MDEFVLLLDMNYLIEEWKVVVKNFEKKMKLDEEKLIEKEDNGEDCL